MANTLNNLFPENSVIFASAKIRFALGTLVRYLSDTMLKFLRDVSRNRLPRLVKNLPHGNKKLFAKIKVKINSKKEIPI